MYMSYDKIGINKIKGEGEDMNKRIAYIGLSYPIRFDITPSIKSWLITSPELWKEKFPIIESPWGLMLLYDELWFLCKDVCPHNMRECSFVKYVVDLFPKIDYNQLFDNAKKISNKPKNVYASMDEHYHEFQKSTIYNTVSTGPTQVCRVGEMEVRSGSCPDNFLFDILIKKEIEKLSKKKVELIVSGNIDYEDYVRQENVFELSNELTLNGIPNYLTHYGPYHPVIDELRESNYLKDYRKWICGYHGHLQKSEIQEVKEAIENELKEIQDKVLLKYMDEHSKKAFYTSTAKTIINTVIGTAIAPYSGVAAAKDIVVEGKQMAETQNDRWAAFVVESRNKISRDLKDIGYVW